MRDSRTSGNGLCSLNNVLGHRFHGGIIRRIGPHRRNQNQEQRLVLLNAQRIPTSRLHELDRVGWQRIADEVWGKAGYRFDSADFFAEDLKAL